MKPMVILAASLLLAACAGSPVENAASHAFPVAIKQLDSSVDARSGRVDVAITVQSLFPSPLKTLRVFVAPYDAAGKPIAGDDQLIEILGPLVKGQSIGPLEKVTSIADRATRCMQVKRVEAIMMDYSVQIASGAAASALAPSGACQRL